LHVSISIKKPNRIITKSEPTNYRLQEKQSGFVSMSPPKKRFGPQYSVGRTKRRYLQKNSPSITNKRTLDKRELKSARNKLSLKNKRSAAESALPKWHVPK